MVDPHENHTPTETSEEGLPLAGNPSIPLVSVSSKVGSVSGSVYQSPPEGESPSYVVAFVPPPSVEGEPLLPFSGTSHASVPSFVGESVSQGKADSESVLAAVPVPPVDTKDNQLDELPSSNVSSVVCSVISQVMNVESEVVGGQASLSPPVD